MYEDLIKYYYIDELDAEQLDRLLTLFHLDIEILESKLSTLKMKVQSLENYIKEHT